MAFGTSPVGTATRAASGPTQARQKFLETFVEVLAVEPSIVQFQQLDILLDGFLWNEETYNIVRKAAEDVFREVHGEEPPWIGYEKINQKRNTP